MASEVKINNIALDLDPVDYLMVGGTRRGSVHRVIGGGTVIQDRGFSETDQRIALSGQLTSLTTVRALYALYRATAGVYSFVDFKGNEYTVAFVPGMESFTFKPIRGSNSGYTYSMHLIVVSVVKILGEVV